MIFFKLPYSSTIWTNDQTSNAHFVSFHSFDGNRQIPFPGKLINAETEQLNKLKIPQSSVQISEESHEDYTAKLASVIDFIKANELRKLVISRRKKVNYNGISLASTFDNLCKNYPNAMAYCFATGNEMWLGAFSELLGKYHKSSGQFETMSLAGTLKTDEPWSRKELEEQQPVTDYIADILQRFSADIYQSETYDHISGNIKHLRTDFRATIQAQDLPHLIDLLHPTPAVCGIPKELCTDAIRHYETLPREFYAGYCRIETQEEIYYFVNLRCAKIFAHHAEIFVGGGITPESNPDKEWNETQLKAEAITRNIVTF